MIYDSSWIECADLCLPLFLTAHPRTRFMRDIVVYVTSCNIIWAGPLLFFSFPRTARTFFFPQDRPISQDRLMFIFSSGESNLSQDRRLLWGFPGESEEPPRPVRAHSRVCRGHDRGFGEHIRQTNGPRRPDQAGQSPLRPHVEHIRSGEEMGD